jgi:hypothetical protein
MVLLGFYFAESSTAGPKQATWVLAGFAPVMPTEPMQETALQATFSTPQQFPAMRQMA